ncbi:MAG: DNA mismatch repair protein MutS, partial [Verrucomicrobiota bacterium]|nr:DNA mismatch repair protein MutS [Verrucomicrobiota bacterium]
EEDAERGAALLGITLTTRHDMPMAGIPSHAAEGYLTKLLALGHKVAICDQLEPPKPGKLVKRGITRILTPGTVLEDGQLEGERNHFLLALELDEKGARASWLDLSTGKFVLTESARPHDFLSILSSLSPKEVLVPEGFEQSLSSLALESSFRDELERVLGEVTRTERPGFDFDQRSGAREVMESLGVMNLEGFGIDSGHPALGAAGAVLVYAQDVLRGKPGNLSRIEEFRDGEALLLDPATQRNLEIFRTTSQTRKGSLLDAMDQTVSPAGARLLERYLASPERDLSEIRRRQGCVAEFSRANTVVEELGAILRTGSDLERILGRLRNRLVRPRELGGLRATVRGLPGIRKILLELGDDFPSIQALSSGVDTFDDLRELLDRALEEELPPEIKVDVKGEGENMNAAVSPPNMCSCHPQGQPKANREFGP